MPLRLQQLVNFFRLFRISGIPKRLRQTLNLEAKGGILGSKPDAAKRLHDSKVFHWYAGFPQ